MSLAGLVRRYFLGARLLWLSAMLIPLAALADVFCPFLAVRAIAAVVTGVTSGAPAVAMIERMVTQAAVLMVALVIVQYLARLALARLHQAGVYRGSARLRTDLYRALQAESVAGSQRRQVGEQLARLVADVQALQDAVLEIVSEAPFDAATILGVAVMMLVVSPALGGTILGFFALILAIAFVLARRGWRRQAQTMEHLGALSARFQEALAAHRTIATLGAGAREEAQVAAAADAFAGEQEANAWVQAVVVPFLALAEYGGLLLALLFGSALALRHHLPPTAIVLFLGYVQILAYPLERIGRMLAHLQRATAAAGRLASAVPQATRPQGVRPSIQGGIHAQGLRLRYPDATEDALRGIDLIIPAGASVALIGRNGAGKSTLCDVVLGLLEPTAGRIAIDGVDLSTFDRDWWRSRIAVVPQEVVLMNRSVAENILLGAPHAEALEEAVRQAGLEAGIAALPAGLDTPVGERGQLLSGGQRQRLAIARAFARDCRIVVLDEPTAALDAQAERELLPALATLRAGRTALIISHRMPVIVDVDVAVVLDRGLVVAAGAPGEVYDRCPAYRDLFPAAWAGRGQVMDAGAPPRRTSGAPPDSAAG